MHIVARARKIQDAERKLAVELGRLLTEEEIAVFVELPIDEVADIRRADRGPTSLDQGVGEDGDTALGDLIAGDGPSVEEEVVAASRTSAFEAVDTLPEAERNDHAALRARPGAAAGPPRLAADLLERARPPA